jgi:hypothetical protein
MTSFLSWSEFNTVIYGLLSSCWKFFWIISYTLLSPALCNIFYRFFQIIECLHLSSLKFGKLGTRGNSI